MEAKNLRIGNFVSDANASDSFFAQVKKLDYSRCYYGQFHSAYSDLKPIPLTKEWLDKFGFDDSEYKEGYTGIDYRTNLIMDFVLTKPNFMGEWQNYYTYDLGQHRFVALHYVHELQNLFFAVTATELELKAVV